jgi:hypothetical protein
MSTLCISCYEALITLFVPFVVGNREQSLRRISPSRLNPILVQYVPVYRRRAS